MGLGDNITASGSSPFRADSGNVGVGGQNYNWGTGTALNQGASVNTGAQNPIAATAPQATAYDAEGNPNLFQPGLFPTATSVGQSGSQGTAQSNTSGTSENYSGLDAQYRTGILSSVLPQLQASLANFNQVPAQYADSASRLYGNLSRQALDQSLPEILQQLASRGMLNSSVGSDAISNAAMQIIPQFANQGYQAQMNAGQMQMQIPSILATLAQLGQYSQGSSQQSGTSGSTNNASSLNYSQNQNPLAPYELLSNFLMGY